MNDERMFALVFFVFGIMVIIIGIDLGMNTTNLSSEHVEIEGEIVGIDSDNIIFKEADNDLVHIEYQNKENLVETENGIMVYKNRQTVSMIFNINNHHYGLEESTVNILGFLVSSGLLILGTLIMWFTKDIVFEQTRT